MKIGKRAILYGIFTATENCELITDNFFKTKTPIETQSVFLYFHNYSSTALRRARRFSSGAFGLTTQPGPKMRPLPST